MNKGDLQRWYKKGGLSAIDSNEHGDYNLKEFSYVTLSVGECVLFLILTLEAAVCEWTDCLKGWGFSFTFNLLYKLLAACLILITSGSG